jgi:hypothetical protein
MKRNLALNKETLAELSTEDLAAVVGGQASIGQVCTEQLSLKAACGRPTCGQGCTGRSDPLTVQQG